MLDPTACLLSDTRFWGEFKRDGPHHWGGHRRRQTKRTSLFSFVPDNFKRIKHLIGHSSGYKWSIVRSSSSSLFQFSCISFEIEKVRQLSWLVSKVSTWAHTWSLTATIRQFRRIFLFQNSVTCLIRLNDCVIYSWNECQVHIVRSSSGIIFEEQCFIRRHVIYAIKKLVHIWSWQAWQ